MTIWLGIGSARFPVDGANFINVNASSNDTGQQIGDRIRRGSARQPSLRAFALATAGITLIMKNISEFNKKKL